MHIASWLYWLFGWIGWGIYFSIEEFLALKTKHTMATDGTLSSEVWRLVRGRQWYHRVLWVLTGIGMAVLTYHFLFQPLHY